MAKNMTDEQINRIAETIAAKLAEPGGNNLLGCGSASSSQSYNCSGTYSCSSYYECGGQAGFYCTRFDCYDTFDCAQTRFACITTFDCEGSYTQS